MVKPSDISRRDFVKKSAKLAAGAAIVGSLTGTGEGHGGPLKKRLRLKINNPDSPVIDPEMRVPRFNYFLSNEFPPSVVTAGGRRHIFISTGRAIAVRIPLDTHILKDPDCAIKSPSMFSIAGFDAEVAMGRVPFNGDYDRQTTYWRKNYCGTFNVDVMKADANHPEWVYAINHCENKNEVQRRKWGMLYYHNSINLNDPSGPGRSSGMKDGYYRGHQPSFFGLVSMSYAPVKAYTKWGVEQYKHDMGPIIWPQTAFMSPDGKTVAPGYKHAHSHPSSLIAEDPKDGKTYLYVWANLSSTREDKRNMVGAARSPIEARGLPGSYLNFYRGGYTEPSLPENMSEDIDLLVTRRGGKADVIHPELYNINRFFVARLKRSGLFLSVESYSEGNDLVTALRLSEDLYSWTDRIEIPNSRVDRRKEVRLKPPYCMYYPKFLSRDGSSHYEMDESEPFYIIATKYHYLVYRELSIDIV
jgi:hypothetical protein